MQDRRLAALMCLRVQGVVPPERFAAAVGLDATTAGDLGRELLAGGLAEEATLGRTSGMRLTADGRSALDDGLAAEGLRGDETLTGHYERFMSLDGRLKQICTDWQIRKHGPIDQPNDHTDADYDQAVIDRLCELHDSVTALCRRIEQAAPRLAPYATRLDGCVERLRTGDRQALTGVLTESYHQIWFELHEDLLLTLGLPREE